MENLYKKAVRYCVYQERSEPAVRAKMCSWGTDADMVDTVLMRLRSERFLDTMRYAEAFITGKLKGNKWGKRKIVTALRSQGIAESDIEKAWEYLDIELYESIRQQVIDKKRQALKSCDTSETERKISRYLYQKGF